MATAPAKGGDMNDLSALYDRATLQYWGKRYQASTGKILDQVIAPVLLSEERRALGQVQIFYPLPGEDPRASRPFGYYSVSDPGGGKIVLPILSLKFLDDLCIAYAWLQVHNYSLETISDYVAMLKYQDLPSLPPVLPTLGIPVDALSDKEVAQLALGHFVTARTFILAHELGHLRFHHDGSSISNEEQADAFAVDVMQRTPLPALGIMVFFMADAQMEDYPPQRNATHPLSADRLRALAARLSDRTLALKIATLGKFLAEPDIQASIIAVGKATTPADLGPRRPGAPATLRQSPGATDQAFNGRFVGQFTQYSDPDEPGAIVVTLRRSGNSVTGEYSFGLGAGRISKGIVDGDTLYFVWEWATSYGHGALHATDGGAGFDGYWGYQESRTDAGRWTAHRER
ncbi:phage exclusion protein Lit family protein [Bradyrhizobium sp. sBnM-33]|uniref:phage exclusion protein Lit family protein n=1 Tax=Bradyrhizobium sp. sBnM-33 TaxID=2831780 RepID=UPI001BD16355|nr:phage exclusion protein Lit family protein [Bradyrhizobium sp. sBnM-33]WOH49265.1 phage exclusion protein Lit family protein [Bradyrhizobium sp. sBnM-33]